jgi:hypothetical protein
MWEQVQLVLAQSLERVWTVLLSILPGFVAMLLVVGGSLAVAAAVRWFLRRSLARIGFDKRAQALGIGVGRDGARGHAPSALVARGTFWTLVLLGIALALDVFGASTTSAIGLALIAFLPRLLVAGLLFVVGVVAARFLERSVLIGAVNMQLREARLLAVGVKWLVLVLASAVALQHVGIGGLLFTIAFSIVLGGIVLTLSLAVGLGSREAVSRVIEKRLREREKPKEPEERAIHHL